MERVKAWNGPAIMMTVLSLRFATAVIETKAAITLANLRYGGMDIFKLAAAFLVITIHLGPLLSVDPYADFVLTGIIARLAVPFFFIASGFFLFGKMKGDRQRELVSMRRFTLRVGVLYAAGIIAYLPLNVYDGYFKQPVSVWGMLQDVVFNGTFYHLWYLPALITGAWIVYGLRMFLSLKTVLAVSAALYVLALLGDSYYGLTSASPILTGLYDGMFTVFDYTRNGIGFAPLYMALGAWAALRPLPSRSRLRYTSAFIVSIAVLLGEGIALHAAGWPRHDSMYLALVPAVYSLFRLLQSAEGREHPYLRSLSTWIYMLHPWAIVLVRGGAKATGSFSVIVDNKPVFYIAVSFLSVALSAAGIWLLQAIKGRGERGLGGGHGHGHGQEQERGQEQRQGQGQEQGQGKGQKQGQGKGQKQGLGLKRGMGSSRHRAWAEIDLDHLAHNLKQLQNVIPRSTAIMAIVKADAYGHGSIEVAKRLFKEGVRSFAVADIEEAIVLRRSGINGEIVVLGYTADHRLGDIIRYRLTQIVVSAEDAERLQAFGRPMMVHVKIDTGMRRLGESYEHIERILSIYRHKFLLIAGTFSHLAAADRQDAAGIALTLKQFEIFGSVIAQIKQAGIDPGRIHLQSSYGMLNYEGAGMNLARPGIALYGTLGSEKDTVRAEVGLRPVLSLKAAVSLVKSVQAGESIGYGGDYFTQRDSLIATLSIGYADGVAREYAERGGYVLINGQQAKIVGKICMDQLMVDVTDIEGVCQGDTATLIGQDGEQVITAAGIADRLGTLTNEVLVSIGSRVERVYVTR
ncbi:serine racemase VanT catalytic subunit [Paenibacillus sp. NPDC058174]|uniref:serine racemase VanT catalytic subunit n=1 Tax=Paenibacillus sp. NPDC058174 TaxID=3346366 RepID=UPI0036D77FA8